MRPYSPSLVPPFSVVHSFSHMASLEDIADNLHSTEEKLGIVSSNLRLVNVDQQPETTSGAFGEELSQLEVANNKLKYRISHLKKSIADENTKRALHMTNVRSVITAIFRTALCKCYPSFNTTRAIIQASGAERFGDYKCVAAMPLANTLKQSGEVLSPRDVAQKILNNLPSTPFVIEKCEVAGPGFINVYVKRSYISELVSDILVKGVRPPPVERKLRVIVDFSSPNVAKEMHVGHLRSTIIGETICRLLEFFGHDVLRLNHVGDWGTQFGMLIAHLQDQFPDYSTVSPPIGDLQKFYRESKKRFDNDENFKKRAYNCVVKLQGNDPEVHQAWKLICDVSRKEFLLIYDRLGVKNQERGESFYEPMMPGIVKDLRGKGLAVIEDGATVMHIPGKLVPLMLAKSDGAHTYDTSDMAALRHRIEEEKGDWLIYVVDAGQGLHFETVFEGGCMAGYVADGVRIDHVGFGVVLGEDKEKN
ncbi:PREDICTED: arginine--tRNA ligase, cytoplasmic-like [Amphimedon queenslandica]|uniref:arginine--tRNA ligase n=1 Tax=Amphimedon queenslandica TaxID=400682 RepID=A0AAN0JSZ3_AMPQE|nr:PREDICTED: arginine--tRNA ligase, cytoplasmic-like [Amphimedon queenslandica]|eukprot:XP_019859940.1 PREDICTED: arginine--tRNA ligase, cytoplasmic-like [Amphimedon queenslandica]